ncbi:MAG TPA: NAD-dependent epimerase/dehydratase family protein [bacterium]|nr:NAD-dependent epimerase/dehydratase family protein [bacterium]
MSGMRCLVTGGAGFIGVNLALALEQSGLDVVVVDNFRTGVQENLARFSGTVLDLDISHPFSLAGPFDAIFHEAAITDPREPDDEETLRNNIEGFQRIIDLSLSKDAKLIYASSASLYGNGPAPQHEDQEKELMSAYAESKLRMDEIAANLFDSMHIVGLRYFNVFGPYEAHKGRPASMIYHLTRQMKSGKRPRIFRDGEQKRDHIYVRDCVLANEQALEAPSGIYNVATGIATSFNQLVDYLNDALDTSLEPDYFENPYKGTYQEHTQADTTRAQEKLGFQAQYTVQEGIREYIPYIEAP